MNGKVLVLGATGLVGGGVAARLAGAGRKVRAATRRPDSHGSGHGGGMEWVEFDLERPDTFPGALEGVDRAFLIARPGDEHSDRWSIPLIDAMKARGVRQVCNLTAMGTEMRPDFALRKIELHLEDSGLQFTHLRPNWFMQMLASGTVQAQVRAQGIFALPAADAKISYIDAADISEVAARVLSTDGHAGRAYTLTGPQALSHDGIARILSVASGREIRYVPLGEDAARAALGRAGFPPEWVERLVVFYRLIRAGYCEPVTPDVETVLGRPATPLAAFAEAHAGAWRTA